MSKRLGSYSQKEISCQWQARDVLRFGIPSYRKRNRRFSHRVVSRCSTAVVVVGVFTNSGVLLCQIGPYSLEISVEKFYLADLIKYSRLLRWKGQLLRLEILVLLRFGESLTINAFLQLAYCMYR